MPKKYFVAFCLMDSKYLRANVFHHSCLILFEANCNQNNEIIFPLRVVNSYGFYSHPFPYQKSFYEEPFSFLCQKVGISFRLRGSFGKWKQEDIHDLAYGRGLSGRLFEFNIEQFYLIQTRINNAIIQQENFLSSADNIIDLEENYKNAERSEFIKQIKAGKKSGEAMKIAKANTPLPEFKFSVTGHGNTCKNAALEMIASCYEQDNKNILGYIEYLKGSSVTNTIPRLTPDLDEIIIHSASEEWVKRGNNEKYPFTDWKTTISGETNPVFVVMPGKWYIDSEGCVINVRSLSKDSIDIIKDLKIIGRICELNITDEKFKAWHKKINHYLHNFSTCANDRQESLRAVNASHYLATLINNDEFNNEIINQVPVNLKSLFEEVINRHQVARTRSLCTGA